MLDQLGKVMKGYYRVESKNEEKRKKGGRKEDRKKNRRIEPKKMIKDTFKVFR